MTYMYECIHLYYTQNTYVFVHKATEHPTHSLHVINSGIL